MSLSLNIVTKESSSLKNRQLFRNNFEGIFPLDKETTLPIKNWTNDNVNWIRLKPTFVQGGLPVGVMDAIAIPCLVPGFVPSTADKHTTTYVNGVPIIDLTEDDEEEQNNNEAVNYPKTLPDGTETLVVDNFHPLLINSLSEQAKLLRNMFTENPERTVYLTGHNCCFSVEKGDVHAVLTEGKKKKGTEAAKKQAELKVKIKKEFNEEQAKAQLEKYRLEKEAKEKAAQEEEEAKKKVAQEEEEAKKKVAQEEEEAKEKAAQEEQEAKKKAAQEEEQAKKKAEEEQARRKEERRRLREEFRKMEDEKAEEEKKRKEIFEESKRLAKITREKLSSGSKGQKRKLAEDESEADSGDDNNDEGEEEDDDELIDVDRRNVCQKRPRYTTTQATKVVEPQEEEDNSSNDEEDKSSEMQEDSEEDDSFANLGRHSPSPVLLGEDEEDESSSSSVSRSPSPYKPATQEEQMAKALKVYERVSKGVSSSSTSVAPSAVLQGQGCMTTFAAIMQKIMREESDKEKQHKKKIKKEKKKQQKLKEEKKKLQKERQDLTPVLRTQLRNNIAKRKYNYNHKSGINTVTKNKMDHGETYTTDELMAMLMLHTCMHSGKKYKSYAEIPDNTNLRQDKDFMIQNFKLWVPGSSMALKCYRQGCFNGKKQTIKNSFEESYLEGKKKFAFETPALMAVARVEFLRRCGYKVFVHHSPPSSTTTTTTSTSTTSNSSNSD